MSHSRRFPPVLHLAVLVATSLAAVGCGGGGQSALSQEGIVTFSTQSVPGGATGEAYAARFDASFPHPPGQFLVSSGRIPPGLLLDSATGELTGFPRTIGQFDFVISARDGSDPAIPGGGDRTFAEALRSFAIVIERGAPNILPQIVPAASYRRSYQYTIDVVGGTPPYTFELVQGDLPQGVSLGVDGRLGSFPTEPNVVQGVPFEFDAKVTDARGLSDTAHFALSVVVLPLIISTSSFDAVAQNVPTDSTLVLASTGGGAPITWTQVAPIAGEILLADIGMEITPDGHLRNISTYAGPAVVGTHTFTMQVTDEAGQLVTRQYQLTVNAGPILTSISPSRASEPGPFVVTGANFQPGVVLRFKPGPTEVEITPFRVSSTELRFNTAPATPGGAGGSVAVRAINPDAGSFTLPNAFVFSATNVSFGGKGFVSSDLSSTGLACADVDGDGWADVVHSGSAGFEAYPGAPQSKSAGLLFHRNLATVPVTFETQTLGSDSFFDVKLADVNLDGTLDIVALEQTSVHVFLNGVGGDALGTFAAAIVSPFPKDSTWPSEMTLGLFDSNLVPDVAFGVPYYPSYNPAGSVHVMTGDGKGSFTLTDSATKSISETYGVISLCAGDSDGDGRDEICAGIGVNPYSGPLLNHNAMNADGTFADWTPRGEKIGFPGYGSTTGIAAADFEGLGMKSVVAIMTGAPTYDDTRNLMMFSGNGFRNQAVLAPPKDVTKSLTALDADFDTKMDFAISTHPGKVEVYRGATLSSVLVLDVSTGSPEVSEPRTGRLASGDLDNDGRPDLLVTTSYWASEGMGAVHGEYYALGAIGDGGSKGVVFYLNTSN